MPYYQDGMLKESSLRPTLQADGSDTRLYDALQNSEVSEFLAEFWGGAGSQLCYDPDYGPKNAFVCSLCEKSLFFEHRPIDRHKCRKVMDVARMREAGVCTPEGKCILCNNRVSGDTHACPWRGITDVTFDFTALHPLERPLPEHPDPNAATRRHRLEVQARHRYLQGKVVFVMPQRDLLTRPQQALEQGRLMCYVALVSLRRQAGGVGPGLLTLQPAALQYDAGPSSDDYGYCYVPLSDHYIAPYTGELRDWDPGQEPPVTSLLTSDGRHVVDPTEVGGVAVLANKTMMTTAVIEKFQDSHIAYLCPTWRTASTFNPIRCVAAKYNQST